MMGAGYNDTRVAMGYPEHSEDRVMQSFYDRAQWELKFAVWPRRCVASGRWCWMNYHYRGSAVWTGPGEDAVEQHWHHHDEHLFWVLKRHG